MPSGNIGIVLAIAERYRSGSRQFARARSRAGCSGGLRGARGVPRLDVGSQAVELLGRLREVPDAPEHGCHLGALFHRDAWNAESQPQHPGGRCRGAVEQRALEVGQHALEDSRRRRGKEVLRAERRVTLQLGEACRAAVGVESAPAIERVEPLVAAGADDEVAGHPDPVERDPCASTHLDHEHAERDREPEVTVEHVVEVRVCRVAVVGRVPRESARAEQERRQRRRRRRARRDGKLVELREPRVDVETLVRVRGDQQRALVERDLRLRPAHDLGEPFGHVQGQTVRAIVRGGARDGAL